MSQKLFAGKPKHEGPFQDFPLIKLGGKSISDWVETLPVVDEFSDANRRNTKIDRISVRRAEIAERKIAIANKISKLECIKNTLKNLSDNFDNKETMETTDDALFKPTLSHNEDIISDDQPKLVDQGAVINQKKESIWTKIKNRTSDLYYKAGMHVGRAMFAAGNLSVGKLMSKPEPKIGENLIDYERRVQRIGMAKIIGLTVLSVVAVHGAKDLFDNINNNSTINGGGHIDHTLIDDTLNGHTVTVGVEDIPDFSYDAYNVVPGEGLYDTMSQMGITDVEKQYEILQKVGPELQNMNLAYPLEAGSWGISNPGQLPKSALELIWDASKSL